LAALHVEELNTEAGWREAYPVMQQLRTDLDPDTYLSLVTTMAADGYRLFALRVDGSIVALAGVALRTNFYYRRYLFVYDLVTDAAARSQGYGGGSRCGCCVQPCA
jgi:hypothetical protein